MEVNFARLKVSDEDLTISFEEDNPGNCTANLNKTRKNKKKRMPKQTGKDEIEDLRNKLSPASETPKIHSEENDGTVGSTIQKRWNEKDKKKSFVSRLRSNTWSPKQSKSPEFDDIGSVQEKGKHVKGTLALDELSYTQLIYLATPRTAFVSHAAEIPRFVDNTEFEDFNSILEDQRSKLISEKGNPEDARRTKNSKSMFTNTNVAVKNEKFGFGDLSSKGMDQDYKTNEDSGRVMRSYDDIKCNFEKPSCKNTCERFDDKIDDESRRYESPRIVVSSLRSDTSNSQLEDHKFENPGIEDHKFKDSGCLNPRFLDQSFMNGRNCTNSGMFFQLPHDDCEKKSCSKISSSCARRRVASSYECLPRLPTGKVNLVQSRMWQRLRDKEIPKSRDRSFTR